MSLEAEQNIIGSLLTRPECLDEIINIATPDMFRDEVLRQAYTLFVKGSESGKTVDLAVLMEQIPNDHYPLEVVRGEIVSAMSATVTSATVKSYATTLANEYRAKRLNDLVGTIRGQPKIIDEEINRLITSLEALRARTDDHLKTLAEITAENKDKYFRDDGKPKIMTGMKHLDEILGGFDGGDLVIIGARPAVGKSAFASQLALYFSETLHLKVGYFNLEMQEKQMYERFVAAKSGIEITRIRRATRYLEGEKERFDKANEFLMNVNNIVISTGSKRVSDIKAECRGQDFGIVIIDYLQLLKADSTYRGNRYAEVGQISHAAKALAMDMNIPVIALCQLNRGVESRENKEPSMSDLRESGDFEQDASTILLLWNCDADNRSKKKIKVEKQRQGKNGIVELEFDGNRMMFYEQGEFRPVTQSNEFMKMSESEVDPAFL